MPLLLSFDSPFLGDTFGEFSYLAPFVVLLLCGVGLPLPEEVTLIGAGILYHREEVRFLPIVAVCAAAILIGDSIPYWLGRRYGENALRVRWVRRIVHPERLHRLRQRFAEHGNVVTFLCRFVAGIRIPGYFIAGTMGMSYGRFLLLDALGVLVSVPISIYLGKVFGGSVDTLKERFHDFHLILAFLVLSLTLILLIRYRRRITGVESPRPPGVDRRTTGERRTADHHPPDRREPG
jgi:membrane protein DedA with SNARE-associated domain